MKRRKRESKVHLGSVSHGTLKEEDLIESFLWELQHNTGREGRKKYREILKSNDDLLTKDGSLIAEEDYKNEDQDCAAARSWLLNEDLFPALDELAPPFCYFGAHEGDGADFGFWVSQEALDEAIHEGEVWREGSCQCVRRGLSRHFALSDHAPRCPDLRMPKEARYKLVVSDHGNMTLYHRNGREVWGVV